MPTSLALPLLVLVVGAAGPASTKDAARAEDPASASAPAVAASDGCVRALRLVESAAESRLEIDLARAVNPTIRAIDAANRLTLSFGGCAPGGSLGAERLWGRRVRGVRVAEEAGATLLTIEPATTLLQYRTLLKSDPPRFVVSLFERLPGTVAAKEEGNRGGSSKESGGAGNSSKGAAASNGGARRNGTAAAEAELPGLPPPKGKASFVSLGEEALADGEVDRGLAYLEAAASAERSAGGKRDLLLRVARLALREGLPVPAARCYRRILAGSLPDSLAAPLRVELGLALAAKHDAAGALAVWDSALVRAAPGPEEAAVRRARSDFLLGAGRAEEALDDLRALARRGRDEAEETYAGYRLGVLLLEAGKSDEALAAFEQVPAEPGAGADSATAYFARAALLRRGDLLYRAGRHEAAAEIYERFVAAWGDAPEAAWAAFQIANADRRAGRYAAARERYEALLARWPESRWADLARWGAQEAAALAKREGRRGGGKTRALAPGAGATAGGASAAAADAGGKAAG